jgi:hypothetical protein
MKYHISCHWRLLFLSCTMWCLHLQSYTDTSFVPQRKPFWQAKTILYVDIERLVSKIFFIQWTHQLFLIRCQTKYFFRFHTADRNNAWFAVTQSPLLWIPDWIAQGDYILGTRKEICSPKPILILLDNHKRKFETNHILCKFAQKRDGEFSPLQQWHALLISVNKHLV